MFFVYIVPQSSAKIYENHDLHKAICLHEGSVGAQAAKKIYGSSSCTTNDFASFAAVSAVHGARILFSDYI